MGHSYCLIAGYAGVEQLGKDPAGKVGGIYLRRIFKPLLPQVERHLLGEKFRPEVEWLGVALGTLD